LAFEGKETVPNIKRVIVKERGREREKGRENNRSQIPLRNERTGERTGEEARCSLCSTKF